MSLQKGFLRDSTLSLTKIDRLWATVIFLVASFVMHLLFIFCYENFHIIYNVGILIEYKTLDATNRFYSWFIAGLSTCSGLSITIRFVLRNKLNDPSFKKRFARRLSYHYIGFTLWGNLSWISRLGHIFTFFFIIFYVDSFYTLKSLYGFYMVLTLLVIFLNTWLMAHRVLKRQYFRYMLVSLLTVLITTWMLVGIKSLDFNNYNQYVKARSVHANEYFELVEGRSVRQIRERASHRFYLRPNGQDSLPEVTHHWSGRKILSASEVKQLPNDNADRPIHLFVDKKVRLNQVTAFEKLFDQAPAYLFYYMALPKQDTISNDYFSYYDYPVWQRAGIDCDYASADLALCNLTKRIKGKRTMLVSVEDGNYRIDGQKVSLRSLESIISDFYKKHEKETLILFKPDPGDSFGEYIALIDHIKMAIIGLRREYAWHKYQFNYHHHLSWFYLWDYAEEMEDITSKYPLNILELDSHTWEQYKQLQK